MSDAGMDTIERLQEWKFVGFDRQTGARKEGVVIAAGAQGAISAASRQDLMAVSAELFEPTLGSQIKDSFKGKGGSAAERFAFLRAVARINTAVKSQSQVLEIAAKQVKRSSALRPAVESLIESTTTAGASLDEAFAAQEDIWGPDVAAIVSAGLKSGNLNESLRTLAKHQQRTSRTKRKIRRVMIQQAITFAATIGVAWMILTSWIPDAVAQADLFEAPVPGITSGALAMSDFLITWGPLLMFLTLALMFTVWFMGQSDRYGLMMATFWMNFPGIGKIIKQQALALASGVIAIGLTAGARSRYVVEWAGDSMPNRRFRTVFHDMSVRMREGSSFGDAADIHVPLVPHEFAALAHQSQLGLEDSGEHWREYAEEINETNEETVDGFATRIGLYSLMFFGFVVTYLTLAWSAPTLSITEHLLNNPTGG